jgi:hypothetical protein
MVQLLPLLDNQLLFNQFIKFSNIKLNVTEVVKNSSWFNVFINKNYKSLNKCKRQFLELT